MDIIYQNERFKVTIEYDGSLCSMAIDQLMAVKQENCLVSTMVLILSKCSLNFTPDYQVICSLRLSLN